MRKLLILLFSAAVIAFSISGCGGGSGSDPLGTDSLTFTGAASQVDPGGTVVLTATVKNASGVAVVGKTVTFGFVKNTSGATAPSNGSAVSTDFDGKALITYKAGLTAGDDIIRASISDRSAEVYITVGSGSVGGGRKIALSGSTISLASGKNSILTATVTDSTGNPVSGQTVAFSYISNLSGAAPLTLLNSGLTDVSGRAVAVYTAGAGSANSEVEDAVKAEIFGISTDVLILTRTSSAVSLSAKTLSLTAGTSSLTAGQSSILAAKVADQTGKPVSGQVVTFGFVGGAVPSGASLSVLNGGSTDASGQALAVYTAGSLTPTVGVQDIVEAKVTGASSVVIITRTASTTASAVGYRLVISAGTSSLAAGQNSILSARVTDQTGNAISGQVVAFRFVGGAALSGGSLSAPLNGGVTDASGQVVAIYTAGSLTPTAGIQDVVEAYITGVASDAVIITRTASVAVPPAGYRLAIAADVTSLAAGQSAIVTATVTNGSGDSIGGQTVTFALFSNSSGATLTTLSGTTDVSGRAVAVYKAGATTPAASVQDTIQASVTGSTGAIVMTRTAAGGGVGTGVRMTVTATPTSLIAGAMSMIVAQVLNADGTSAVGQTVTFQFLGGVAAPSSGSLTNVNATTDASGTAIATYTAGNNLSSLSIQDVVTASVTGSAGAVIITRTASTAGTYAVSISPSPAIVTAGQVSIITATVAPAAGGITVTFTMPVNQSLATLSSATATTDGSGKAVVIYRPGTTNPDTTVQDTVQAAVGTATDVKAITRTGSSTLDYRIAVIAAPTTLSLANMNSVVTATVTNNVGTAVSGVTVTFARDISSVVLGTVLPLTMITDGSGRAQTVYTGVGGVALATGVVKASITIGGNTYTAAVIITNP